MLPRFSVGCLRGLGVQMYARMLTKQVFAYYFFEAKILRLQK